MAAALVTSATSDKLAEMDWSKNIEVCELVAQNPRQAKDVIKALKKRLGSRNQYTQLYAVMLLETLMNNIGENIHSLVISTGVLPLLVKIVKKKSGLPVRERIFDLLDATQTSLGGASGKFPEYYSAYYELVSAGAEFPVRPHAALSNSPSASANQIDIPCEKLSSVTPEGDVQETKPLAVLESSTIQKAANVLEILRDVLKAVDSQNPEEAKDEFTLDLVEQCSYQKQRVMHLVMASRDEEVVSQAIDLNEQLEKVLARHEALVSGGNITSSRYSSNEDQLDHKSSKSTSNRIHHPHDSSMYASSGNNLDSDSTRAVSNGHHLDPESNVNLEEKDEEPEQLIRIRKGKEPMRDEDAVEGKFISSSFKLNNQSHINEEEEEEEEEQLFRRRRKGKEQACVRAESADLERQPPSISIPIPIPPPPAKHMERERFFKQYKMLGE